MKEEASLELSAVGPFVFLKGRRDKGGAEAEMRGMSPRRIVRRTRQTRRVQRQKGRGTTVEVSSVVLTRVCQSMWEATQ